VALRRVEIKLPTSLIADSDGAEDQAVRLYSSAVVLTQRLIDWFPEGRYELLRHLKRLAHRLILNVGARAPVMRAIVQLRGARRDEASRAVHTAILAVLGAKEAVDERRILMRVVTGSLMLDLGFARAAGITALNARQDLRMVAELTEEEKHRLPGATAFLALSVGQQSLETLGRAAILWEALTLMYGAGAQGGPPPSLEAALISVARRLVNLVADAALTAPITFTQAAAALAPTLKTPLEKKCLALVIRGAELKAAAN
jgi:hypothetical protein